MNLDVSTSGNADAFRFGNYHNRSIRSSVRGFDARIVYRSWAIEARFFSNIDL